MSATDELCRKLDERGVEYERNPWSCGTAVWWRDSGGTMWRAHDNEEDELLSFYAYNSVTPEQAVEATMGRGECTDTGRYCFTCSQCGWAANEPRHVFGGFWPNFCPNCGRKVVGE